MKSFILSLIILSFSQVTLANDELASIMEEVGQNFKVIAQGLQAGHLTDVELEASELLQRNLSEANLLIPDVATSDELLAQYNEVMGRAIDKAMELEDSIREIMSEEAQDITPALMIFSEINDIRKEGHAIFKPD